MESFVRDNSVKPSMIERQLKREKMIGDVGAIAVAVAVAVAVEYAGRGIAAELKRAAITAKAEQHC